VKRKEEIKREKAENDFLNRLEGARRNKKRRLLEDEDERPDCVEIVKGTEFIDWVRVAEYYEFKYYEEANQHTNDRIKNLHE
jgi:hypothetical protein